MAVFQLDKKIDLIRYKILIVVPGTESKERNIFELEPFEASFLSDQNTPGSIIATDFKYFADFAVNFFYIE